MSVSILSTAMPITKHSVVHCCGYLVTFSMAKEERCVKSDPNLTMC